MNCSEQRAVVFTPNQQPEASKLSGGWTVLDPARVFLPTLTWDEAGNLEKKK